MYCTQCGASIGEKEIRCPYCGAVNPFADEQKYMERLQKILQETEALSDEPMRQYGRELKQHGKRTLKIALAVGSVFVALALLFLGVHLWQNRQEASSARARLALEQQYIPRLDALYAEGNYEEAAGFWIRHMRKLSAETPGLFPGITAPLFIITTPSTIWRNFKISCLPTATGSPKIWKTRCATP